MEAFMKVEDIMSKSPDYVSPDATLEDVAKEMLELNTGIVPVGENDKLTGMITDRDIAIRAVARGKGPEAQVKDIMSDKPLYCFANDNVKDVLENMKEEKVHRLIVLNNEKEKRLAGMLSISDIARECNKFTQLGEAFTAALSRDANQTACCA